MERAGFAIWTILYVNDTGTTSASTGGLARVMTGVVVVCPEIGTKDMGEQG